MPPFSQPGLIPLKIYSGSILLTNNVNLIQFTGSGINVNIGKFNDLIISVSSSNNNSPSSSYSISASYAATASFYNGSVISASYAATASYVLSASWAPSTPPFPYTGSAQITGSLGVTGSISLRSGSNFTVNNGLILAGYGLNNLSVGGTPGWTSGTRNISFGLSNQGSVLSQTDNVSVGYLSLLGGNYQVSVGNYSLQFNTGDGNVALGYYALGNATSNISYNIAIGYQSMYVASGSGNTYNVSLGYQSLYNNRGSNNIGIGYRAGFNNKTGNNNIFLGWQSGYYTGISNNDNVSIGYSSGARISGSDTDNVMIGSGAGGVDVGGGVLMGSGNIGIGSDTLRSISSSAGVYPYNVAIGFQALRSVSTGQGNIGIGGRAGWGVGRGIDNIFMGTDVGLSTTSQVMTGNISIGKQSMNSNVSASYNIAIGLSALNSLGASTNGSNYGNENVGIGYNAGSILKTGIQNVFIGSGAGRTNSGNPVASGSYCTFIGAESGVISGNDGDWGNFSVGIGYAAIGYYGGDNPRTPGIGNTALGSYSLSRISSSISTRNLSSGYQSAYVLKIGANNTLLGSLTAQNLVSGSSNIFIGDSAGSGIVTGSNNTIIGSISGLPSNLTDTIIIAAGTTERIRINATGSMGIGTTTPDSSALLDLVSTTKGVSFPTMTNAQRTSISSPKIGLMVYCTDATEGLYIYKSTGWTFII